MSQTARHVFGVDIGGTFTDVVLLCPDGRTMTRKVASTTSDYADAILLCLHELLADARTDPAHVGGIVHGTTIATNTILEGRGARTALITTRGFRDVLEMRRLRIPVLYDLQYAPPRPLAPRRLRFEVGGRIGPDGAVWETLDAADVDALADRMASLQVEALAIALINSYANPAHERQVADIMAARVPRRPHITLSSDILPEMREYERTSTAVVNAYIGPVVERYLSVLDSRLAEARIAAPLRIMQSNGGVIAAQAAASKPAHIIESGPAAGVIASAALARQLGIPNAISLDMGGTTAKAALIEGGEPAKTSEYEVGAGINISSKLVKGGGHAVKLPFIDVSEIGAGGGSLVSVDALGGLRVGPRSAGSNPGPCCYGLGGTEPTFTDAMVVLGYNSPDQLAGGRLRLRPELAHEAIATRVAAPLGVSPIDAAWGVYAVAAANMMRAVKAVSTYRGRDPRDFTLFAFGGNGPLAAPEVARALGIRRIIVPPIPGLFSAFGLLCSHTEYVASRTLFRRISELDPEELVQQLQALETQVRASLHADGIAESAVEIHRHAELRYAGQAFELPVPLSAGRPDPAGIAAAFDAEHQRTYGHSSPGAPTDLVSLQVLGRARTGADPEVLQAVEQRSAPAGSRPAYFGPAFGLRQTPVLARAALGSESVPGPLIIEEDDATTVVPPDASCRLDAQRNIDIVLGA